MGWRVPETGVNEIREIQFHNYRIIYRIESKRILILALIQGRLNVDDT